MWCGIFHLFERLESSSAPSLWLVRARSIVWCSSAQCLFLFYSLPATRDLLASRLLGGPSALSHCCSVILAVRHPSGHWVTTDWSVSSLRRRSLFDILIFQAILRPLCRSPFSRDRPMRRTPSERKGAAQERGRRVAWRATNRGKAAQQSREP